MRGRLLAAALAAAAALHGLAAAQAADPASDAPEGPRPVVWSRLAHPPTYAEALQSWRTPDDVNAWIAERFAYDIDRAVRLSESQRRTQGSLPIHAPADFYARPHGICVDLARFAVETLRSVAPQANARYLMIEFDPAQLRGQTLRRHWVALFERDGSVYAFADSKRPGHVAGPYASVQAYVDDYAAYRGRPIVSFRELTSYARKTLQQASRRSHGSADAQEARR